MQRTCCSDSTWPNGYSSWLLNPLTQTLVLELNWSELVVAGSGSVGRGHPLVWCEQQCLQPGSTEEAQDFTEDTPKTQGDCAHLMSTLCIIISLTVYSISFNC